jgi:hypothetical protein
MYWIAVVTSVILWSLNWDTLQAASSNLEHLFGLFGFCVFCVLFCFAYFDFRHLSNFSYRNLILIGLPFLISLFFLSLVIEFGQKSWDYNQYEAAFRSVAIGDNPYLSKHFLYPPPFVSAMVGVYQLGKMVFPLLQLEMKESMLWNFVFFIHQSTLLFFLYWAYYLSIKFSEMIGINKLKGILFISGLFLFNVPVLRTISYNQINFYILVFILLAMLLLSKHPYVSGFAIAAGGLIKLYPFALIVPLLVTKKWKVLWGIVIGVLGITIAQTKFFQELLLWKQFTLFYISFPIKGESSFFRNTSPLGFIRNLFELLGLSAQLVLPIFGILFVGIIIWFMVRFLTRERIYSFASKQQMNLFVDKDIFRNIGHLVDFSVLVLLLEPLGWEHHFVIAIPLTIWVIAAHKKVFSKSAAIGILLVFLLPVFNIFPLSYLRLLGLVMLIELCSPRRISNLQIDELSHI